MSDYEISILGIFEDILEQEKGKITLEQTFEELKVNSISFIGLVVQCEIEFDIQFEDEMLLISKFPNVDSFAKYVQMRAEQARES